LELFPGGGRVYGLGEGSLAEGDEKGRSKVIGANNGLEGSIERSNGEKETNSTVEGDRPGTRPLGRGDVKPGKGCPRERRRIAAGGALHDWGGNDREKIRRSG